MTFDDVFNVAAARGVRLVSVGNQLRAQGRKGAVSDALRSGLTEHKSAIIEALAGGVFPDDSLPDELVIPAHIPNELQAIRACIDAQRVKVSA